MKYMCTTCRALSGSAQCYWHVQQASDGEQYTALWLYLLLNCIHSSPPTDQPEPEGALLHSGRWAMGAVGEWNRDIELSSCLPVTSYATEAEPPDKQDRCRQRYCRPCEVCRFSNFQSADSDFRSANASITELYMRKLE